MHNDSTDEQTITELQNQVKLTQMNDDELVSRLCLAYLDNHAHTEPQQNEFREYRLELMRRLAQMTPQLKKGER